MKKPVGISNTNASLGSHNESSIQADLLSNREGKKTGDNARRNSSIDFRSQHNTLVLKFLTDTMSPLVSSHLADLMPLLNDKIQKLIDPHKTQITAVFQDKNNPNLYRYLFSEYEKHISRNESAIDYLENEFSVNINDREYGGFVTSKIYKEIRSGIEQESSHKLLSEVAMGTYIQGTSCLPPPVEFSSSQPIQSDTFKCAENEMVRGSCFRPIPLVGRNNGELILIGAMYLVYDKPMKKNPGLESAYLELLHLGLGELIVN